MSTLVLGIDEAGYGPNLGPLVICATLWELSESESPESFWGHLSPLVVQTRPTSPDHIQIADSKQVYSSTSGIKQLEHSVLSLLTAYRPDFELCDYSQFKKNIVFQAHSLNPWFQKEEADLRLPVEIEYNRVKSSSGNLQKLFLQKEIRCRAINPHIIHPIEFNRLLLKYGNKGQLLSQLSLKLIHDTLESAGINPEDFNRIKLWIYADKQGGRKNYAGLINEYFPLVMPRVINEEQVESRYLQNNIRWQFSVGSERYFPVAVASMFAKYFRELEMEIFNRFWEKHVSGIKPTAGYPVDAKRFVKEIAGAINELGIPLQEIWREK